MLVLPCINEQELFFANWQQTLAGLLFYLLSAYNGDADISFTKA